MIPLGILAAANKNQVKFITEQGRMIKGKMTEYGTIAISDTLTEQGKTILKGR